MLKKKTAVLFVEPDGTSTKRVQVPTFLVTHWKKILCSFVACIGMATFLVVYLVKQRTSEKYIQVYDQKINKLKAQNRELELNEFSSQLTAEEMKKSFHSLDSAIERINEKMKKRGLKEIKMNHNMGG